MRVFRDRLLQFKHFDETLLGEMLYKFILFSKISMGSY